jgi:hypothetical protein
VPKISAVLPDERGAARRSEALELAETARADVVLIAEFELCLSLRRGEPGRSWDRNVPVSAHL